MSDLTDFQRDHLFLLVGSNPLPNYVAAKLLARPDSRFYFVYSKETQGIATNLATCLGIGPERIVNIQVDDAEADNIYEAIKKHAVGKESLGLHYTGGTKAMAVHAYRAVYKVNQQAIFSYLNARNLHLLIDRPNRSEPVGLGENVSLSIEELLKLHGYKIGSKKITATPFYPDFCQALLKVPQHILGTWCYCNLKEEKESGKIGFKNKTSLRTVELPINEPFTLLQSYWEGCFTLGDLEKKLAPVKIDALAEFLDGIWLEHYVLDAIQQVKANSRVGDTGLGIEPVGHNKFEFDVIAMRGYQLFALSCTTSADKRRIKSKLFEAYIRARQMGGDEARVAMVCRAPKDALDANPAVIEREVKREWEGNEAGSIQRVRVFGEEHLPNLSDYLRDWFNHSAQ